MNNISNDFTADTALFLHRCGLNLIPIADGEKKPASPKWGVWQKERQTEGWIRETFTRPRQAAAIVTGAISGNLVAMDFDQAGVCYEPWKKLVPPELHAKLVVENSRRGGRHVWFRLTHAPGGATVLARDESRGVLIETRAEGNICICAPSVGQQLLQGSFDKLPVLTDEEYAALVAAARTFNRHEAPNPTPPGEARPHFMKCGPEAAVNAGLRPGDIYNVHGVEHFGDMITSLGWQAVAGGTSVEMRFRRPGKKDGGCSATLRRADDGRWWWHVFSTSTELEPVSHSLFAAFARMACGGDFAEAARQLADAGFREDPPAQAPSPADAQEASPADAQEASPADTQEVVVTGEVRPHFMKCGPEATPPPVPLSALPRTGLIGQIADYTDLVSPRRNEVLSWGGAFAFASFAAGCARYRSEYRDRPNVYLLSVAPSAAGKSQPIGTNFTLAREIRMDGGVTGTIASGQGLEDAVAKSPRETLVQLDEFHKLLAQMRAKDSSLSQVLASTLLQFYSASSCSYPLRKLSQHNQRRGEARPEALFEPHVTVAAWGIAEFVFSQLTAESLSDGLLGRFLLLESETRGARVDEPREEPPPRELVAALGKLCWGEACALFGTPLPGTKEPGRIVRFDEGAKRLRREMFEEADRRYNAMRGAGQEAQRALVGRLGEKASKVALVLAVSDRPEAPVITEAHIRSGWEIADTSTRRLVWLAENYTARNDFDEMSKRVLRLVRERGGTVNRTEVLRELRVSRKDCSEVVETLLESGRLVARKDERARGRPATVYSIAG